MSKGNGKPGRPQGAKDAFSFNAFCEALKEVEHRKKKTLYQHAIERAYVSDAVLKCLLDKLLPTMIHTMQEDVDYINTEIDFLSSQEVKDAEKRFIHAN